METLNVLIVTIVDALYTLKNGVALLGFVVSREPSWCLGDDKKNEEHRNNAHALEYYWNPPGIACGVAGEGVVDPVDEEDTEVEC